MRVSVVDEAGTVLRDVLGDYGDAFSGVLAPERGIDAPSFGRVDPFGVTTFDPAQAYELWRDLREVRIQGGEHETAARLVEAAALEVARSAHLRLRVCGDQPRLPDYATG